MYHAVIFIFMQSLIIVAVAFIFCLQKLSIFDTESHRINMLDRISTKVFCCCQMQSRLGGTITCDFTKFGIDTQGGLRPQKKFLDWTILVNTKQYYAMLDNIRKQAVPSSIQLKLSASACFLAYLLSCLLTCSPVYLLNCLLVFKLAPLVASLLASWLVCLFTYLLLCLLACLLTCLRAYLLTCFLAFLLS